MMKHFRLMAAALCAAFLLCGMTAPAHAYSDEPTGGYEETDPAPTDEDVTVEEAPAPEPTIEPGEGFSEEGQFVTRDLLYDENTNKQFITVQTKGGSTFYLVIDYDKPVDEEGEQYETYFLGVVDESDLLAASGGVRRGAARLHLHGEVRGGGREHGLPRLRHQHGRVRGGGAGARTGTGA